MKKILPVLFFALGAILMYWAWSSFDSGTSSSNSRMSFPPGPVEPPDNTGSYLGFAGGGAFWVYTIISWTQNIILKSHQIANERDRLPRKRRKVK